jgi:GTPase
MKVVIKKLKEFTKKFWSKMFKAKGQVKLGFYGPPNAGKTSLANRICQD